MMLRFSYSGNNGGERWDLCGQLSGPWVDELRSAWRRIRERSPSARPIVVLKDVTFIDEAGEQLLAEMQSAGAEFVAAGVEQKHLLANLGTNMGRTVRRRLEHLRGGCQ
jgi:hypothetical protein